MICQRVVIALFASVMVPTIAVCDDRSPYGRIPPPIPSGPPLELPAELKSARPTWLEDNDVRPASVLEETPPFLPGVDSPRHPTPPPATYAGSACNFDSVRSGDVYSPDYGNIQVLFGAYYSSRLGPAIPDFNYWPITIRQGWMLTSSESNAILPGNWEFLADVTVAPITSKYGHIFGGPSFFLRKNLSSPGASIVPYCQGGVGFILNDAHQDQTQLAIGQMFEFYLHAQVGVKLFLSQDLSLDLEVGMQHISNANLASRNHGVNAFGGQVGFTYYFPWQGK
jgi:hypothetical protein